MKKSIILLALLFAAPAQAQIYRTYDNTQGTYEVDVIFMSDAVVVSVSVYVEHSVSGGEIWISHTSNVRVSRSGGMVCYEPTGGYLSSDRVWGCVPETGVDGLLNVPFRRRAWFVVQGCAGNNPRWTEEARNGAMCRKGAYRDGDITFTVVEEQ